MINCCIIWKGKNQEANLRIGWFISMGLWFGLTIFSDFWYKHKLLIYSQIPNIYQIEHNSSTFLSFIIKAQINFNSACSSCILFFLYISRYVLKLNTYLSQQPLKSVQILLPLKKSNSCLRRPRSELLTESQSRTGINGECWARQCKCRSGRTSPVLSQQNFPAWTWSLGLSSKTIALCSNRNYSLMLTWLNYNSQQTHSSTSQ